MGGDPAVVLALYRAILRAARRLERASSQSAGLESVRFNSMAPAFSAHQLALQARDAFQANRTEVDATRQLEMVDMGFAALRKIHALADRAERQQLRRR